MYFISDSLENGREFRVLDSWNAFNRKTVVVEAEFSIPSIGVIQVLKKLLRSMKSWTRLEQIMVLSLLPQNLWNNIEIRRLSYNKSNSEN